MNLLERIRRAAKVAFVVGIGVVLYVIATSSGAGWLYVVAAGTGGVVVVSALAPLYNTRGIEVTRRAPVVGTAGEPLSCSMEVRSTGRVARYMIEVQDQFAGGTGGGVVTRARRSTPESLEYEIENPRRGVYSDGEVRVASGAPFGLFHRRRRTRVPSSTTIYPRTFEVANLRRPSTLDESGLERDPATEMHRGIGDEFWGVREYRPGDPARLIAWRQSARSLATGRLSVMELARETAPPLTLSINLDPRASREAREMVVSVAASVMSRALSDGFEVAAEAGVQRSEFPERPSLDEMLTWCARLTPARPPAVERSSVAILPSIKYESFPVADKVVLISCYEFAGPGPWMNPAEERAFIDALESAGRRVTKLGPDISEPWRMP